MATVHQQSVAIGAAAIVMSSASVGGDLVDTGDHVILLVINGATATDLTITTPNTEDGLPIGDRTVAIGANEVRAVDLPTDLYGNADGLAALAWSSVVGPPKFAVLR